jgi:co-chaperonin GroES (HSP10)
MPAAVVFKLADSDNPVVAMKAALGDISNVEIGGARVLVWLYIQPRTKNGIIMPDSQVKEDVWQGCVGLILKMGPLAFKDDPAQNIRFEGFSPKEGDWVTFSPGEGRRLQIRGVDLRVFEDALIQAKIPDPDMITHR